MGEWKADLNTHPPHFMLQFQAFTETQKKRLLSWKQQVLKLLRTFPRKAALEMQSYRQQKG